MANQDCLLVCNFGNFLVPVLVPEYTVRNVHLMHDKRLEDEGYESD